MRPNYVFIQLLSSIPLIIKRFTAQLIGLVKLLMLNKFGWDLINLTIYEKWSTVAARLYLTRAVRKAN